MWQEILKRFWFWGWTKQGLHPFLPPLPTQTSPLGVGTTDLHAQSDALTMMELTSAGPNSKFNIAFVDCPKLKACAIAIASYKSVHCPGKAAGHRTFSSELFLLASDDEPLDRSSDPLCAGTCNGPPTTVCLGTLPIDQLGTTYSRWQREGER